MSADSNLNLGGNADLIRPKYIFIYLGLFLCMNAAGNLTKTISNSRKDGVKE